MPATREAPLRRVWKAIEDEFACLSYHLHRIKYSQCDSSELRRHIAEVDLVCMRLFDEVDATEAECRRTARDASNVLRGLQEFMGSVVDEHRWIRDRLLLIQLTMADLSDLLSPIADQ